MTQVITRYFENAGRARMAKSDLVFIEDFSPRIIDLYDEADQAKAHLAKNHVDAATISAYADKLEQAGVDVRHKRYDSLAHGFAAFMSGVPAAKAACTEIAEMIREAYAGLSEFD